MTQSQRGFVASILIATAPCVVSIPFGSPALAVTCASSTQRCIAAAKDQPDRVARCTAAGESCAKSEVFVCPYTGDSYTLQKAGVIKSCHPNIRGTACYSS